MVAVVWYSVKFETMNQTKGFRSWCYYLLTSSVTLSKLLDPSITRFANQ